MQIVDRWTDDALQGMVSDYRFGRNARTVGLNMVVAAPNWTKIESSMTWHSLYVGDLEDPSFTWGDYRLGNLPRRIGGHAVLHGCSFEQWALVVRRIEDGIYEGCHTDLDAYVVKLNPQQILTLAEEFSAHGVAQDLQLSARDLSPEKIYALVAMAC